MAPDLCDICLGGSCCGEHMGYHDVCRLYLKLMRGACARGQFSLGI